MAARVARLLLLNWKSHKLKLKLLLLICALKPVLNVPLCLIYWKAFKKKKILRKCLNTPTHIYSVSLSFDEHMNTHASNANAGSFGGWHSRVFAFSPPPSLSWKFIANKIAIKRGKTEILLTRGTNPCLRGILGADMMSCAGVSSEKCSRASQRFRNCFSAAWELRNSRRHVLFFFFFYWVTETHAAFVACESLGVLVRCIMLGKKSFFLLKIKSH